jgi:tripartite-type tricarboxylate transporter receptor subunit TctC
MARVGTLVAIVKHMNTQPDRAFEHPEFKTRQRGEGAQPAGDSPQAFSAFFKAEIAKWSGIVRKAGIRAE